MCAHSSRPGWWGTHCPMILTSAVSFKVLDQLENQTPVWKYLETGLPSESCLNDYERLGFFIGFHTIVQGRISLDLVEYIKMLTLFQQLSKKRIKSTGMIWKGLLCFNNCETTWSVKLWPYITYNAFHILKFLKFLIYLV